MNRYYLSLPSQDTAVFLEQIQASKPDILCYSTAFNKPWLIDYLTACWQKFVRGAQLAIVDNSTDKTAASEIRELCKNRQMAYLKLPTLSEHNPNRSHARALNWTYHHLTQKLGLSFFGLIDHDLFPVQAIDYAQRFDGLDFYGHRNGVFPKYWNLWAGYSFYRTAYLQGKAIDFHPQHHLGLDTGGRNWPSLYSKADSSRAKFVTCDHKEVVLDGIPLDLGVIDDVFVHVGGAGYATKTTAQEYVNGVQHYLDGILQDGH